MTENNLLNEINKYFALATLIMPAIVMLTMRRWVTPISGSFFSQDIFRFISYGIFNFAVFLIFAQIFKYDITNLLAIENLSKGLNCILHIVYVFIEPFVLGLLLCIFDRKCWLSRISYKFFNTPLDNGILTMWEEIFSLNPGKNVRITLKNGKIIEGLYANGSKASTSVTNKDIYLRNIYKIDNIPQPEGAEIWIDGNDIETILFTDPETQTACSNCKNIENLSEQIKNILDIIKNMDTRIENIQNVKENKND